MDICFKSRHFILRFFCNSSLCGKYKVFVNRETVRKIKTAPSRDESVLISVFLFCFWIRISAHTLVNLLLATETCVSPRCYWYFITREKRGTVPVQLSCLCQPCPSYKEKISFLEQSKAMLISSRYLNAINKTSFLFLLIGIKYLSKIWY